MSIPRLLRCAMVVGSIGLAQAATAQAPVTGIVRSDSSGAPIQGVQVIIEGQKSEARTDADGKYLLVAPKGTQFAIFRMLGFREIRLRLNVATDTVRADVQMVRQTTTLPVVDVEATGRVATTGRDGFAERRAKGPGKFIDSVALRAREHRRLSDVLAELTGVKLQDYRESGGSLSELRAVNPIRQGTPMIRYQGVTLPSNPPCWVSVFYDGVALYRSDRMDRMERGGVPPDFSRDFSVASLEAVEYYRSAAEVPQQYGGGAAICGALVLWSRR